MHIMENYFNLIEDDISELNIIEENSFDCILKDNEWKKYIGFILAKSKTSKALTICDVGFHKSNDWKYKSRLTFRRTDNNLQDKKVPKNSEFQRICFEKGIDGYKEFWKMVSFLMSYNDLVDTWDFEKQYSVVSTKDFMNSFKNKNESEQKDDIDAIIESSSLTPEMRENLAKNIVYKSRLESLEIFKKLLDNIEVKDGVTFIDQYKIDNSLKANWEETAWHYFLKSNPWIIWINLDLKFIEDFESEWNVGIADTTWKWSPNVDIIGISDYTTLIELKTANKNIFTDKKKNTSRSNTWSFSDDFIDGISQALWQKTEWDKHHDSKDFIQEKWEKRSVVNQDEIRTIDTKTIFLIWNRERELPSKSTDPDIFIKRDTFKRYRENSKNIKIMTFDELYQRAKNILEL